MGPGRGSTITYEWESSNPVTPSEIRWREKYSFHPERKEDCKSAAQLRGSGTEKMCFHGLECMVGGVTVVRMIIVMKVRTSFIIIIDPIRHKQRRCCIIPACCIFPAPLTSVMELLTVHLPLLSARQKSFFLFFFYLAFARKKKNVE